MAGAGVPGRAQPTSGLAKSYERDPEHVPLEDMKEWGNSVIRTIHHWNEEVAYLKSENEGLRRDLRDLQERTAIASERAARDQQYVEDITKTKRPSQIARSYSEFVDGERMDAIEILDKEFRDSSNQNERLVCVIIGIAFEIATAAINSVRQHLPWAMVNLSSLRAVGKESSHNKEDTEIHLKYMARHTLRAQTKGGHVKNLMDSVYAYLKNTSDSVDTAAMEQDVLDELMRRYPPDSRNRMKKKLSLLENYISQCCRLAWQLVVQTPSMHIQYGEEQYDPTKHRLPDKSHATTSTRIYYLWPTLLSSMNGNVVCKGIVLAEESKV